MQHDSNCNDSNAQKSEVLKLQKQIELMKLKTESMEQTAAEHNQYKQTLGKLFEDGIIDLHGNLLQRKQD